MLLLSRLLNPDAGQTNYNTVTLFFRMKFMSTCISIPDFLYAIGGKSDYETWASVEGFELEKEEWFIKAPLPMPLSYHAGCEYGKKVCCLVFHIEDNCWSCFGVNINM
jgi:hypothetical protein